jgi:hypothetical protein
MDMDNIINFPARASEPTVLEFEIGIGSVDEARRTLECLEAAVTLGLRMVEKAESEAKILAELHHLFAAFHSLVPCDRGIRPLCSLPKLHPDDPPGAA